VERESVCVRKGGNSVGVRFGDQKRREDNSNVRFMTRDILGDKAA
jgi:hypothetical protein